jgi:hypothetical protein
MRLGAIVSGLLIGCVINRSVSFCERGKQTVESRAMLYKSMTTDRSSAPIRLWC